MSKVYIAAAFRRFSNRADKQEKAYGEMENSRYADLLENIEAVFIKYGFDTCLPHRDEGKWGKVYYEPSSISKLCLHHVFTSDLIFAITETSRGVHIEIGYAAALKIPLILMYKEGSEPSTLIWGLQSDFTPWDFNNINHNDTIISQYNDANDLIIKLEKILSQKFPNTVQRTIANRVRIGTIDIGSHTVKLNIFSFIKGSQPIPIFKESKSIGIIDDVLKHGAFGSHSIDEIIRILSEWKTICDDFECKKIIVSGTAALRKASNSNSLLGKLRNNLSLEIDILTHEKELDYVFSYVKSTFNSGLNIAVLNLGGGSIQLGIGRESTPSEKHLFNFGTNDISKRWPWNQSLSDSTHGQMIEYVTQKLEESMPNAPLNSDFLVHTGGELDFMLKCQLPLRVSSYSSKHVSEIPLKQFIEFSKQFCQSDPDTISDKFGIDKNWVMGSVASNVIAISFAQIIKANTIIPSNINISGGLVFSALENGITEN